MTVGGGDQRLVVIVLVEVVAEAGGKAATLVTPPSTRLGGRVRDRIDVALPALLAPALAAAAHMTPSP